MLAWTTYTTADDFLTDDLFRQWVRSGQFLQAGHPHTDWLKNHPHLMPPARQAADWLAATAVPETPVTDAEINELVAGAWQKIRALDRQETRPTLPHERRSGRVRPLWSPAWFGRAAAVVALVGGFSWWLLTGPFAHTPEAVVPASDSRSLAEQEPAQRGPAERGPAWIRETNRTASPQLVSLSDGSTVYLTPNSTLRYPVTFAADRREVELVGEAFFEVAKNARQPFFVRTPTLTTRVVGTSFLVRAPEYDTKATVQVRTGRVVVWANQSLNRPKPLTVALRADQQVTVQPTDQTLTATPVSRPADLAQRLNQQTFVFTDAPVPTVLDALAQTYAIPIEYDATRFANCRITTTLSDEPLTEKLSILAEVIGPDARYEVDGNQIRFSGKECFPD